jgi:hypothetical protein
MPTAKLLCSFPESGVCEMIITLYAAQIQLQGRRELSSNVQLEGNQFTTSHVTDTSVVLIQGRILIGLPVCTNQITPE